MKRSDFKKVLKSLIKEVKSEMKNVSIKKGNTVKEDVDFGGEDVEDSTEGEEETSEFTSIIGKTIKDVKAEGTKVSITLDSGDVFEITCAGLTYELETAEEESEEGSEGEESEESSPEDEKSDDGTV